MKTLTERECNSIIFQTAIKHGVNPKEISEKLLSDEDKQDMMNGELPVEVLEIAVLLWKECGCKIW
jgi:hypothetical protein